MKKIQQDLISGTIVAVFSAIMIMYIIPLGISVTSFGEGASMGINSQTFPLVATYFMLIASCVLIVSSGLKLLKLKKEHPEEFKVKNKPRWKDELRTAILVCLCVLYAILFSTVGYVIATLIIPPCMLLLMGSRDWKHYVSVYCVGIVIYVIFKFIMGIPLP
ncbi:tripartite tricarboxylate transporter TctB family protein [Bengtsoniella intestinalis]|uniref:tripartite tricarboxylate transporter TctB family protein n=1 Tax=Bengtsoniella intestinalis TaxID=3073143 RepID=UPI00391F489A